MDCKKPVQHCKQRPRGTERGGFNLQSFDVWAWALVSRRTGQETEGIGELPERDSLEFDLFDAGEIDDQSQNAEGKIVRFSALPDPTTLNAERKPLDSFEAGTGVPASKGIPYDVDESARVLRQIIQFIHHGIQQSSMVVPNPESSGIIAERQGYGR